jgi:uncharacterized surface protein with fasciclin (FAS1) repeats
MNKKIYKMDTFKNLLRGLFSILLIGTIVTFSSCSDDDDAAAPAPTKTLSGLMAENTDLSILSGYLQADPGLKALVDGSTTHTLFAPDNAAFAKLEALIGPLELVAPQIISATLYFHFTVGDVESSKIANGTFVTLQGESIIGNADGTIKTGGSDESVEVLKKDELATNGRMHVVETILIPPTLFSAIGANLGKLSQPILLGANFTMLAQAIAKADIFATESSLTTITSILAGDAVHTVFAATNETFEAAAAGGQDLLALPGSSLYGLIMNSMTAGIVNEADMVNCYTMPTLFAVEGVGFGELEIFFNTTALPAQNGIGVYFDSTFGGNVDCTLADQGASLANLDAELALAAAFTASNGLLHVTAGVLSPQ